MMWTIPVVHLCHHLVMTGKDDLSDISLAHEVFFEFDHEGLYFQSLTCFLHFRSDGHGVNL